MNPSILKLYDMASQDYRRIIGLMSGTSLDGLDVAICKVSGSGMGTKVEVEHFVTVPYDEVLKDEIIKVFAKQDISLIQLTMMHKYLGTVMGRMVLDVLKSTGIDPTSIDIIASHGQTVFHAPVHLHNNKEVGDATLQIGDGDQIATMTGIPTISDFRQKHIAAGGSGAPLAPYGDYLLFSNENEGRVLLNIGGIANFTYLPAYGTNISNHQVFATDTGPGNTLMDHLAKLHFGMSYDHRGDIASQGRVDEDLLKCLKRHPFFTLPFPKSCGQESFNWEYVKSCLESKNVEYTDVMTTLCEWTAWSIGMAIQEVADDTISKLYVSGGGAKNETLMRRLAAYIDPVPLHRSNVLDIDEDAKEAVLFAVLANECIMNNDTTLWPSGLILVRMGKISLP